MTAIAEVTFDTLTGDRLARRNALVLAMGQALAGANNTVIVATGGILGSMMAPDKSLATLPISLMVCGMAAGSLPVGVLARRYGRRTAYQVGAVIGCLAGVIGYAAVMQGSFALYRGRDLRHCKLRADESDDDVRTTRDGRLRPFGIGCDTRHSVARARDVRTKLCYRNADPAFRGHARDGDRARVARSVRRGWLCRHHGRPFLDRAGAARGRLEFCAGGRHHHGDRDPSPRGTQQGAGLQRLLHFRHDGGRLLHFWRHAGPFRLVPGEHDDVSGGRDRRRDAG